MAEILLADGVNKALVDAADVAWLSERSWSLKKAKGGLRYAVDKATNRWNNPATKRTEKRPGCKATPGCVEEVRMHRLILPCPPGQRPDHANGNGLDNRRSNLRCLTNAENTVNSKLRRTNTTGYRGVSRRPKTVKYVATIAPGGVDKYLGTFDSAKCAALAYDAAAREHFGSVARFNFPAPGERGLDGAIRSR